MAGYTMALPILRKAAELGSTDAMFYLGVAYDNGRGSVQVDKAAAFGWFKKAADLGNAAAQYNCGNVSCRKGEGAPQDKAAAFDWFVKAAGRATPMHRPAAAICCWRETVYPKTRRRPLPGTKKSSRKREFPRPKPL